MKIIIEEASSFLFEYNFWVSVISLIITTIIPIALYLRWKKQFILQKCFEKAEELVEILHKIEMEYINIISKYYPENHETYQAWEHNRHKAKSCNDFNHWLWNEEDCINSVENFRELSCLKKVYDLKKKRDELYFKYLPRVKVLLRILKKEYLLKNILSFIDMKLYCYNNQEMFFSNIKSFLYEKAALESLLCFVLRIYNKSHFEHERERIIIETEKSSFDNVRKEVLLDYFKNKNFLTMNLFLSNAMFLIINELDGDLKLKN